MLNFYFPGQCYDSYYTNALEGKIKLNSYFKVAASQVVDKMQVHLFNILYLIFLRLPVMFIFELNDHKRI